MDYVIRDIPEDLDKAPRDKATAEGKTVAVATMDVLRRGLLIGLPTIKHRDLSDLCGASQTDPDMDRALEEFERVDTEQWK